MTFRYALRTLARDRGFTLTALLTIALGIAANTAIFSIVNGVLLKPLAFPQPDRLFAVREIIPKFAHLYPALPVNARHAAEWSREVRSFESLTLVQARRFNLAGNADPEQVPGAVVSGAFFRTLGVTPALGRDFLPEEDRPGAARVVILSDGLWRRRFNADPQVIGRTVPVDGAPALIVGVLPSGFRYPPAEVIAQFEREDGKPELFRPLAINVTEIGWAGDHNFGAIARLRPGASPQQATAELNTVQQRVAEHFESHERMELRAAIHPLRDEIVSASRLGLLVLCGAVGLVLLIVCVNLANLLFARSLARRRESAIRSALGASKGALVRQVLAESLLLATVGGVLGTLLAWWAVRLFVRGAPVSIPRVDEVAVDGAVLLFALGATLLTGVLFGIVPAVRVARSHPADALRAGGRGSTDSASGMRIRRTLVALEVALSVTLLAAAGLLMGSFMRLMSVDKGFEPHNVIAADISLPNSYSRENRGSFYQRLVSRTREIAGVRSAGIVNRLPLEGEAWTDIFSRPGDNRPLIERPLVHFRSITPGYLESMGVALRQGRFFDDTDRDAMPAVISARLAQRIYGAANPIGQIFRRAVPTDRPFQIVGVAADIRGSDLKSEPGLMVYVPYWYRTQAAFTLVARTAMDPRAAAASIRDAVRAVDSGVPVARIRTMQQVVSDSVSERRFRMLLVVVFGAAALALAALGIYGVVSYAVTQRRGEMGIRLALGATPADLHRLIVTQGLAPVAIGLVIGIAGSLALGRVLSGLLFEVSPRDPATIGITSLVLLAVATLACLIPSRRAAASDPAEVLRCD